MKIFGYTIAQARKSVVALIGALVILTTSALTEFGAYLSPSVAQWIASAVAVVTAVAVYLVRNAALIDALGDGELPSAEGEAGGR